MYKKIAIFEQYAYEDDSDEYLEHRDMMFQDGWDVYDHWYTEDCDDEEHVYFHVLYRKYIVDGKWEWY